MHFGACHLSLVPIRSHNSDKSEILSYLLFGDTFEVLEAKDSWRFIRTLYDDYQGWIDHKQYLPVGESDLAALREGMVLGIAPVHLLNSDSGEVLYLTAGATIPATESGQFKIADRRYSFNEVPAFAKPEFSAENIRKLSTFFLHTPYLWGGKSLFGIDCSGFTQIVFKLMGIALKRDAWQQAEQGDLIGFLQEARIGDLAFFDNDEGRIIHVGIMLSDHEIIHASGRVKIDRIDNQGIFSADLKRYSHKLRIIRRMA